MSQTGAVMKRKGLVSLVMDKADGRSRLVRLTPRCRAMLPRLQEQGAATNAAAEGLDAELSSSLRATVAEAIAALEKTPFRNRTRKFMTRSRK